jgi:hypothetical protein
MRKVVNVHYDDIFGKLLTDEIDTTRCQYNQIDITGFEVQRAN